MDNIIAWIKENPVYVGVGGIALTLGYLFGIRGSGGTGLVIESVPTPAMVPNSATTTPATPNPTVPKPTPKPTPQTPKPERPIPQSVLDKYMCPDGYKFSWGRNSDINNVVCRSTKTGKDIEVRSKKK